MHATTRSSAPLSRASSPAFRIGAALVGSLAALLAVIAVVRPEMMQTAMLHRLIVGFGL